MKSKSLIDIVGGGILLKFLEAPLSAVFKYASFSWMPYGLRFLTIALAGIVCGFVLVLAIVFHAAALLGDLPEACITCYVTKTPYVTWEKGSHARTAHCKSVSE